MNKPTQQVEPSNADIRKFIRCHQAILMPNQITPLAFDYCIILLDRLETTTNAVEIHCRECGSTTQDWNCHAVTKHNKELKDKLEKMEQYYSEGIRYEQYKAIIGDDHE